MDRKKGKRLSLIFSAIIMAILIVIAVFVNRPQKKKYEDNSKTTTEFISTEEKQTEANSTEEEMTEAPKDTSNWEMQPAQDTTPDTGEKIQE